ncbi:MAG: flagellar hook-basal body complex protein FliE [Clostridia bacterium]|jgi:flagellar hook-basal body complex protein FliE|nr:flagellar hook-basal body complex protein FliE [Clostridia bacterium]
MKIETSIQSIQNNIQKGLNTSDSSTKGLSFGEFLNSAIQQVNGLQIESEKLNESLALGLTDNIQQVMIASEKASVAMQFTMQIRNKVLDAYQEIMRMPI